MEQDNRLLVQIRNISKKFDNTQALSNVSFDINKGEVHGLLGENGAGKSTLVRILSGCYKKDSGELIFQGKPYEASSIKDAIKKGVSMVFQESNLVPSLSVAENLFLGDLSQFKKGGIINWKSVYGKASEILGLTNLYLDPKTTVSELNLGIRKLIEFARVLYFNPRLMILDEITACLTQDQIKIVFEWIKKHVQTGNSVIYISHRMEELFEICNVATILKDGKYIDTVNPTGITTDQLSSLTVGRDIESSYNLFSEQKNKIKVYDDIILEVDHITKSKLYKDISFKVRKGEILGFAGLDGSGNEEVIKTLFGLYTPDKGEIRIKGKRVEIANTKTAMNVGIGYIPKERESQGLINMFAIKYNICLPILEKLKGKYFLSNRKENITSEIYKKKLKIKSESTETICNSLSGGNKQKVVIAKWLAANSDILLLNNPTRGVDVGVKSDIYNLIFELAENGITILLVSGELPEIIRLSHRIITMARGQITGEYEQSVTMATEEQLIKIMM